MQYTCGNRFRQAAEDPSPRGSAGEAGIRLRRDPFHFGRQIDRLASCHRYASLKQQLTAATTRHIPQRDLGGAKVVKRSVAVNDLKDAVLEPRRILQIELCHLNGRVSTPQRPDILRSSVRGCDGASSVKKERSVIADAGSDLEY